MGVQSVLNFALKSLRGFDEELAGCERLRKVLPDYHGLRCAAPFLSAEANSASGTGSQTSSRVISLALQWPARAEDGSGEAGFYSRPATPRARMASMSACRALTW